MKYERGCCSGCIECFGTGNGCHQQPCQCSEQCSCEQDEQQDLYCKRHSAPRVSVLRGSSPLWQTI